MSWSSLSLRVRQLAALATGVIVLSWAARAVRSVTGLDGVAMNVLGGAFLVVGVLVGLAWARDVEPSPKPRSARARWGHAMALLGVVVVSFVAARVIG